jgi:hypothetical protein
MNQTIFDNKQRSQNVLTANWINDVPRQIFARIVAGNGIQLQTLNDNLIINSTGSGSNGNSSIIPIVAALPKIPTWQGTAQTITVYWADASRIDGGTGDNQLYSASYGASKYYPVERFSTKNCTPLES